MILGFTYNVRSSVATPGVEEDRAPKIGLADDAEEEFDSLATVNAIADTLRSLGHEVLMLGDGEPMLRKLLDGPRPDLVFNMAEGTGVARSREARVPAVLEMLGIPHTGSDPLTLAVALDKPIAKQLVASAGVRVPRGVLVKHDLNRGSSAPQLSADTIAQLHTLTLPVIAKPAFEGSSKGVFTKCLITEASQLLPTIEELCSAYQQPILVEEFIDGDELTVGVVGNAPAQFIGIMRIIPNDRRETFVYTLEDKRDINRVIFESPAALTAAATAAVEAAARTAFQALGCRDLARIDFRLRDGVPYFIEANPLPGLSPTTSDLVILAKKVGMDHRELLGRIIAAAVERLGFK